MSKRPCSSESTVRKPVITLGSHEQRVDPAKRRRRDAEGEEEEKDEQQTPPVVRLGAGEEPPDEGDAVGDAARLGRTRHAERNGDQERNQQRERDQLQRDWQEASDFEKHRIAGHPRESEAAVGQSPGALVGGEAEEAQQLIDDGPVEAESALCLGVCLLAGIEPHQPGDGVGRQQPDEEEDGQRHAEQLKHGDPEAAEDEAAGHGALAVCPHLTPALSAPRGGEGEQAAPFAFPLRSPGRQARTARPRRAPNGA